MFDMANENSRRVYEQARRSFEAIVEVPVERATSDEIEGWLYVLRARGRSIATCRTYLSAIRQMSGEGGALSLPAMSRVRGPVLTMEQVKALLREMTILDWSMFASSLICGGQAREWVWGGLLAGEYEIPLALEKRLIMFAHSRNLCFSTDEFGDVRHNFRIVSPLAAMFVPDARKGEERAMPMTTQELTRRLKRWALFAGLKAGQVSLQTLSRTRKHLLSQMSVDKLADELLTAEIPEARGGTVQTVSWEPVIHRDPRLRRIGRRAI